MAKTIKYTGSADNYAELAVTGRQSVWQVGQQEERSDADVSALLTTGQFSVVANTPVMVDVDPVTQRSVFFGASSKIIPSSVEKGYPTRDDKIIFDGQDLAAFSGRGANAGGGSVTTATTSTITEAIDIANGDAGGTLVTMVQGTTDGTKNIVLTPRLKLPVVTDRDPWFFTVEIKLPTNGWVVLDLLNEVPANLIQITVGNPAGQVKVNPSGGTILTVSPAGFVQTNWFRILCAVVPTGSTTGRVLTYLYHSAGRAFIGETTYSSAVVPTRLRLSQQHNATQTMYFRGLLAARTSGVVMGCSLEAGYSGFNMAPSIPRDSNIYDVKRNPANLIAAKFNGQAAYMHGAGDWWINHAMGGYTAASMKADFQNWVLDINPTCVVIGSVTNSVMAALSTGDPAAYMAQAKADWQWMVTAAQAAGLLVFANGVAPRHEAAVVSLGLSAYAALAKDFNAWAKTIGIRFYDPWAEFEDPATPNQLNPLYDTGDHVHYSALGQRFLARRQYEVWA